MPAASNKACLELPDSANASLNFSSAAKESKVVVFASFNSRSAAAISAAFPLC